MKESAQVMSTWAHTGTGDGNVPRVGLDHDFTNDLDKLVDVSGQTDAYVASGVEPNTYVVYIECETATMDAIDADPNYSIMPETRAPL